MKRLIFNCILLNALVLVFFIHIGCSENGGNVFKNTAKQLKNILVELKNVKGELKSGDLTIDSRKEILIIDMAKKNQFISARKDEWDRLSSELKVFIRGNPESSWADDAGFSLVMLYLSLSQPGNSYYAEAIKEIKVFLNGFATVQIEDWTKRNFVGVPSFELIFNKNLSRPDDPLLHLPEGKRIRGILFRAVVYELLKSGHLSEAKEEFEILKENTKYKEILFGLRDDIKNFEQFKNSVGFDQQK